MTFRCHACPLSSAFAVAACLVTASLARPAAGHGTPFSVGFDNQAGKITVSPGVYRNFDPEELFVLLQPGLASNDGTPGWDRGASLPSGTQLSVQFMQPLAYWNPKTAPQDPLPVPQGRVSILGAGGTAEVAAASGQNASGISGANPLFIDAFTSHHHVVWDILDPDTAGLYGLWARLESTNPAAFAAAPSDPFLVVLNWGITDSQTYNTGVDRLAVLVPEPTTPVTDIVFDIPTGTTQTQAQAGYPVIAAADSVTKAGGGTLVFDARNSYTGPTVVSAGTLQIAHPEGVGNSNLTVTTAATLSVAAGTTMKAASVIVDGGTLSASSLAVNNSPGIASLAINAGAIAGSPSVAIGTGGQMSLVQDARVVVAIGGLAVDSTTGGGRLDLGAGQVTIAPGGISAADLRADIIAARNGGAWSGAPGITSSTAAASGGTRAVGYVVAGDGSARVSFAASGDVDLSGAVNVFDLVSINSSGTYGSGAPSVWSKGDFNYDGVTNVFDLVGVNTAGAYGLGNYFPAAPTAAVSLAAVPEPAGWLSLLAGLAALAPAFRRRASVEAGCSCDRSP